MVSISQGKVLEQSNTFEVPILRENSKAEGVAKKTKNPGNMTGHSAFGTGELYEHPKTKLKFTVFESFTKGYAGNGYRLIQYIAGKTRYLSKNPTLRQLVKVWVGTPDESELTKRAKLAGISNVDAHIPLKFNYVLSILLALGKFDSSYYMPEEAKAGLALAWQKWLSEGNTTDEASDKGKDIFISESYTSLVVNNETNRRQ